MAEVIPPWDQLSSSFLHHRKLLGKYTQKPAPPGAGTLISSNRKTSRSTTWPTEDSGQCTRAIQMRKAVPSPTNPPRLPPLYLPVLCYLLTPAFLNYWSPPFFPLISHTTSQLLFTSLPLNHAHYKQTTTHRSHSHDLNISYRPNQYPVSSLDRPSHAQKPSTSLSTITC